MALTFIDAHSYSNTSSASAVITKPDGTAENDLMLCWIYNYTYTVTAPGGWTLLQTESTAFVENLYYKVAGASEGSDYTFTGTASRMHAVIATYRGIDPAYAIDTSSKLYYATSNTTVQAGTLTVAQNASVLVWVGSVSYYVNTTTFTAPSGYTEDYDAGSNQGEAWVCFAHKNAVSEGATGAVDGTIDRTLTTEKNAFLVSVRPAPPTLSAAQSGSNINVSWS